jgi:hypothetical protein
VQDSIKDKFLDLLVQKAKELVVGDGFDEKSGAGPLVCLQWLDRLSKPLTCLRLGSFHLPRFLRARYALPTMIFLEFTDKTLRSMNASGVT